MSEPVVAVRLTSAELQLLTNALHTYLSDFGHEDYDLIVRTRQVLAKLSVAAATTASAAQVAG